MSTNSGRDDSSSTALRVAIGIAATRLFAELGYRQVSMQALAEAAGCTKATVYYHFGSKEAVFRESIRAQVARYVEELRNGYGTPAPVRDRLIAALTRFFDCLRVDPQGLRLLYRAVLAPDDGQPVLDAAQIRSLPIQLTVALLREGIEAGEVRADMDVEDAVLTLLGMVEQRCRRLQVEGVPMPDDLPGRLVDIFFNGARRRAGRD
ncbi:MAG: hypothetical protein DRJ42_25700 [Deltaproteobacteria bacterium]|nr:MAG: hypothetical protein DRJ42_25700 [Deltaproteobacteria bacterium]